MARRMIEQTLKTDRGILSQCQLSGPVKELVQMKTVDLDKHYGGVFSVQYNFDGSKLVAGFNGGGIRMYNSRTGEMIRELRPNRHGGYAIMCLRFHPTKPHIVYAGTAEGHVHIIDTETAEVVGNIVEKGNQINALDFCTDGFNFATTGKDLAVRVYTTSSGKLEKTYEGLGANKVYDETKDLEAGNTMRVYALKYHPDNENIFITAGWDNHIKIWDSRTNDGIKRQIHGPHVCGDALDMKGHHILSGSWCANNALQEWHYGEGKLVRNIKFPNTDGAFLYCAQYGEQDTVLAGGSGTNSVEVIEASTNKHLGGVKMTKPIMALDVVHGGELFAVGGGDNMVKLCCLK